MFDFISFSFIDFLDVLFVAVIFYQVYKVVRGTGVMAIFVGIFLIYLGWIVARLLGMELISNLLGQVIGIGALALVVVFQQEIRRYLLMLGRNSGNGIRSKIFTVKNLHNNSASSQEIFEACVEMSADKTGVLIVMERTTDVDVYASTGDRIDAPVSKRLLESIFFKNSPLHDGAVVIRRGVIIAARCILPTSDNPNVPAHLGLRHRAALGVSENTDAMVIVVSEETGRISIIENGVINTLKDTKELLQRLTA